LLSPSRHRTWQTNASDAIDDIALPPHPSADELPDAGVKETFPVSDPVAVQDAYWRSAK
jgi:hypothetical protein